MTSTPLPDGFFAGRSPAHQTMRSLARRLDNASIGYAIYGGMAVSAYGHRQTSDDVDVLLTPEGLTRLGTEFGQWYEATRSRCGRRFLDRANAVPVDIVVSGHRPGVPKPDAIRYPDPADVGELIGRIRYVSLPWLIQLKLAMGRFRDLGDIGALIRAQNLDESYLKNLHSSVHQPFIECLKENRRDDEFDALE